MWVVLVIAGAAMGAACLLALAWCWAVGEMVDDDEPWTGCP